MELNDGELDRRMSKIKSPPAPVHTASYRYAWTPTTEVRQACMKSSELGSPGRDSQATSPGYIQHFRLFQLLSFIHKGKSANHSAVYYK